CLALAGTIQSQGQAPQTPAAAPPPASAPRTDPPPVTPQRALVNQYCMTCHADAIQAGGLALSELDLDAVHENRELAEKVIRKLGAGLMPPAGARRPDARALADLVSWLEEQVDAHTLE